jgi:hypothetical protein
MDNLSKQHAIVIDNFCVCKRNVEFVDHLLLHCKVACVLWNFILVALGYLGLCLVEYLTCLLVGRLLVALGVLLCVIQCLLASCSVFKGK